MEKAFRKLGESMQALGDLVGHTNDYPRTTEALALMSKESNAFSDFVANDVRNHMAKAFNMKPKKFGDDFLIIPTKTSFMFYFTNHKLNMPGKIPMGGITHDSLKDAHAIFLNSYI